MRFLPDNLRRRVLRRIPVLGRRFDSYHLRTHPFDLAHGTDTSGFAPPEPGRDSAAGMLPYIGAQPSMVRRVLASLPNLSGYTFVDIGCGKGRPLIVASEFPFARIVGVELSPSLVAVASRNAAITHRRFPERCAIEVVHGDATTYWPGGERLVFFFYHAFGRELFQAFVDHVDRHIASGPGQAFVIYLNPVNGDILDRCASFARWSTSVMQYDAAELGTGPDTDDAIVVWQSVPASYPPQPGADRPIRVVGPFRAGIDESTVGAPNTR